MGKLKEFKADFQKMKENVNLISEKFKDFENIPEDLYAMKGQFDKIYTQLTAEPTAAQMQEQEQMMKEEMEGLENMVVAGVRKGISDMLEDPENQKNIQAFFGSITASGQELQNEDGSMNWMAVMKEAQKMFGGKGSSSSMASNPNTKGAYG